MPGLVRLVPGIHVLLSQSRGKEDVDGRDRPDKPGHDEHVAHHPTPFVSS